MNIISITQTGFVINWEMPDCIYGEFKEFTVDIEFSHILHYVPHYCSQNSNSPLSNSTTEYSYYFTNGIPDANYSIGIGILTSGGENFANLSAVTLTGGRYKTAK